MSDGIICNEVLDELVEFAGSEALVDLHGLFVEQFTTGLPSMRQQLADGQAEALNRQAHTLKGTAAYMGLSALRDALQELEKALDNSSLIAVESAYGEACRALDAHPMFAALRGGEG